MPDIIVIGLLINSGVNLPNLFVNRAMSVDQEK